MKTLYLLRHAKSSWSSHGVEDHDRDLNDRGRRDAPRMGAALSQTCPAQPVFVSSALRAQRTLEGLVDAWPQLAAQAHCVEESLYTFDYRDLLGWLQEFDSDAERCFIIGHNPGLTDLCNQLSGRPVLDNLPTAGYVEMTLAATTWGDVTEGVGDIARWLFPKDLD